MTIQSIIIDKRSLILASDLAVTLDEYKSYIGVKKIFEIDKNLPVGIMINGAMEFENIPLETLISEFITTQKDFENVEKVRDDFIKFLSGNTTYTSTDSYIKEVLKSFKPRLKDSIDENGFEIAIKHAKMKEIPEFVRKYSGFNHEFHDIIPIEYDKKEYNLLIWKIFSYEFSFEGTGIVIAGFNEYNHYPSLCDFNIYCNDNGEIIWQEIETQINCEEPLIRVYAMNEEAYSFLTGVSDEFIEYIKNYINVFNNDLIHNMEWHLEKHEINDSEIVIDALKKELKEYFSELDNYIQSYKLKIIEDTSDSCEYLPRQLLCDFIDILVKLTAIKQKLSLDLETVSSESDIAVITKGENFKWAKFTKEIV